MSHRSPQPLRPFLKWAGNKFRIIERIHHHLPSGKRLVEPFAGSGAVFLNSDYDAFLLCDTNRDLIDLYTILRDEGEAFIDHARHWFDGNHNDAESYYALRDTFNACDDPVERAALFLYLNRYGYNGLCRYNASGGFNVPFGRYKRPYFPTDEMRAFHRKAQRAEFRHQAFDKTLLASRPGDVIYCDPPYVPLSASANFTSYSAGGFPLAQQEQLALLARETAERGIPVLISNHSTPFTRDIYQQAGARLYYFSVQRNISCNVDKRNTASELLALFPAPGAT